MKRSLCYCDHSNHPFAAYSIGNNIRISQASNNESKRRHMKEATEMVNQEETRRVMNIFREGAFRKPYHNLQYFFLI